jgi:hypothetical protein
VAGKVVVLVSSTFSYSGDTNSYNGGAGQIGYTTGITFSPSGGTFPSSGNLLTSGTPVTLFMPNPASFYDGSGQSIGQTLYFSAGSVYHVGPINTAGCSVTSGSAGTGYAPGDTGQIDGEGDGGAAYTVLTVGGGGAVLTFSVTAGGTGYVPQTGVTTTVASGGGDGTFEVDVNSVVQPNGTLKATLAYYVVTT